MRAPRGRAGAGAGAVEGGAGRVDVVHQDGVPAPDRTAGANAPAAWHSRRRGGAALGGLLAHPRERLRHRAPPAAGELARDQQALVEAPRREPPRPQRHRDQRRAEARRHRLRDPLGEDGGERRRRPSFSAATSAGAAAEYATACRARRPGRGSPAPAHGDRTGARLAERRLQRLEGQAARAARPGRPQAAQAGGSRRSRRRPTGMPQRGRLPRAGGAQRVPGRSRERAERRAERALVRWAVHPGLGHDGRDQPRGRHVEGGVGHARPSGAAGRPKRPRPRTSSAARSSMTTSDPAGVDGSRVVVGAADQQDPCSRPRMASP